MKEKVNILLVDDSPTKLMLMESILVDLNENIVKVNSGNDALRFLLSNDVAVILLDVNMPIIDGFETGLLIRQRKRTEQTPIIYVTAYETSDIQIQKGYELGAVDYLFTPIKPEILKAKVKVFADLFRMNQQAVLDLKKIEEANISIQQLNNTLVEQKNILELQSQLLEDSNKELESFSFSVSHDLRTPLRHISGYADLLKNHLEKDKDEKVKKYIKHINDSISKMSELIDDLLQLSRIQRAEIKLTKIDLNVLIAEVQNEFSQDISKRNIKWTVPVFPNIYADLILMKQVFDNYIGNALKYSRNKPETIIEFGFSLSEKEFILFIKDNGAGFSMDYSSRLFQVFQRLHTADEFEGTGIGLANVKKIISKHGGRVWAEAKVNEGAAFYFSLPISSVVEIKN